MKKVIFSLILILSINCIIAQEFLTTTSRNSRFFAIAKYDGKIKDTTIVGTRKGYKEKVVTLYSNVIDIYQINTTLWLRSFDFYSNSKSIVDKIGLSNDGLICYAKIQNNYAVWNIVTGQKLYENEFVRNIGISNQSGIFAVADFDKMYTYDAYTGEKLGKFNISKSYLIDNITFSEDDKYIIVKTNTDRIFIFETATGKNLKTFNSNEIFFFPDNKLITTVNIKSGKILSSQYNSDNYEKNNSFSSSTFINELNRNLKLEVKNDNSITYSPIVLDETKSKTTEDGKYLILYAKYADDEIIFCIDNITYNLVSYLSTADFKETDIKINLSEYDIYDNENLVIPFDNNSVGIYYIQDGTIYNSLNYMFDEVIGSYRFPLYKQVRNRHLSPNYKYILLENGEERKPTIFAKSTVIVQSPSRIEGVNFIDFSPNSKYIFLKKKNGQIGYVKTIDIAADMGDSTGLVFYPFGDTLVYPAPEDIIIEDAEYPDEYTLNTIKNFKYIGDVEDSILIKLSLKTIAIDGDTAGIQVHLIDKDGTYYYGASEEKWRYVWKSLFVKSETSNKLYKIDNFNVTEYYAADSLPNAIAIVLDHSGSMGDDRALKIQEAAKQFIYNKNPNDGIVIVKYDDKIGIETKFSTNKEKLIKGLEVNGLKNYGGCTSLLDAIDLAVNVLDRTEGYYRKSVVILTDGNENSSLLTKGQVLKHTVGSDVNIYTIGFGSFVSEDYLKAIAFYTQGTYYQIYKTEQFDVIFEDIYKKMKYYYTIDFKTDTIGEFTTLLEIALDENRKDSIITSFSNKPVDFMALDTDEDADIVFTSPTKEISIQEFNQITEFVEFSDSLIVVEIEKQDSIKREFELINFPDVKFILNETTIVEGTEKGIEEVIEFMQKNPTIIIEIQGHTDQTGTYDDNMILSEQRAFKVKKLITDAGISANRVITKGLGEAKLLVNSNLESANAKNRRVEFYIKSW